MSTNELDINTEAGTEENTVAETSVPAVNPKFDDPLKGGMNSNTIPKKVEAEDGSPSGSSRCPESSSRGQEEASVPDRTVSPSSKGLGAGIGQAPAELDCANEEQKGSLTNGGEELRERLTNIVEQLRAELTKLKGDSQESETHANELISKLGSMENFLLNSYGFPIKTIPFIDGKEPDADLPEIKSCEGIDNLTRSQAMRLMDGHGIPYTAQDIMTEKELLKVYLGFYTEEEMLAEIRNS